MRAIAEWLVLRVAAATECVMLERGALIARLALQLDAAAHPIALVVRNKDFGLTLLAFVAHAVFDETECSRRTLPDDRLDLLGRCTLGRHEWFTIDVKDLGQMIGAVAEVRARASIVEHGDLFTFV